MNELQNALLTQYCQTVQSKDWCFYIINYLSVDSRCACGVTDNYIKSLALVQKDNNEVETEGYLLFCGDEDTIRQVYKETVSFLRDESFCLARDENFKQLREENLKQKQATQSLPDDHHTWVYTDYYCLDRAFFLVDGLFKYKPFRFAQTSFIRDAFVEHVSVKVDGKIFLKPTLFEKVYE